MTGYLAALENEVMATWRSKSRNQLYRSDPEAWLWDVLGLRWHRKQREIAHDFVANRRTATKSSNGAGKSRQVGELISWGVATHDPGELLVITSAPTLRQIEETTFAYLSSNYSRAKARNAAFPGYLTDSTHWNYRETPRSKSKTLVLGQRPSDRDIVGSFQGIRAISDKDTKTWVFIDEGGAVHDDLYVAAEAVTTGAGDNKINVIGNPDKIGTYFQKIFEDEEITVDWTTNTISAFDLPTFTGEIVYDDSELQRMMLESGMIDPAWVDQKKRAWGEDSARYRSKVLGEFPDADDFSFFSTLAINRAQETVIEIAENLGEQPILGVDLADNEGAGDDSKTYVNRPGLAFTRVTDAEGNKVLEKNIDPATGQQRIGAQVRHHSTWSSGFESVNRIHEAAIETDADVVVIDALGVGAGPTKAIMARGDRRYTVIAVKNSEKSPDPSRWANYRAYTYDMLREGMLNGTVSLDYLEEISSTGERVGKALRDQLLSIRFDFNNKGAIQIESKKDMRKRGVDSPDDLDAVVMSVGVKARAIVEDPLADLTPGDTVMYDPYELEEIGLAGMPI